MQLIDTQYFLQIRSKAWMTCASLASCCARCSSEGAEGLAPAHARTFWNGMALTLMKGVEGVYRFISLLHAVSTHDVPEGGQAALG